MGVDCWKRDSTVVHLSGENFVSEKPIAKYATITVGTEQTLLSCYIGQIAYHSMHAVVLFLHVVQMFAILIDLIVTKNSL